MLRQLDSHDAAGEPGLSYTMELNGEQVRAGARRVAPTVLDFGIADALLGDNPITLDSLCFGPGRGSLVKHSEADDKFAQPHPLAVASEDEEKKLRGEDGEEAQPHQVQISELLNSLMVYDGRYKWIRNWNDTDELYDLRSDPQELHNIFDERPEIIQRLRAYTFRH